jgi:hypothetical protein
MRGLLHVLAILLAMPQVLVCAAFLLLGHLTGGRTLGSLFMRALNALYLFFGWGGLVGIIAMLALIVAGYDARSRRWAAGIVAAIVLASTAMLLFEQIYEWALYVPGLFALVLSVALALPSPSAARVPA